MGIFSFIQKGAQEMFIARPDAAKGLMVYKHPDPTIPMKAQLTVMDDECAFFFKDGHMVGKVDGGRRVTLETSNIPFLDQIIDKFTGGNVLKAEVWFVTMREMAGLKFGGHIGTQEDPKSGVAVETRVHGNFSIQVNDPVKAIQFFGTRSMATEDEFEGFFKDQVLKVIRDRIGELLVKKKWPMLDVTSGAYTEEIEQEVIEGSKVHLDRYGVMVGKLGNFEISIDEADAANLKEMYTKAAYLRMTGGNVGAFQQFAAGSAMMDAGKGMAKGGGGGDNPMLGGAGMGVGFGMAQMFQNQAMQQQQQMQQQQMAAQQQQMQQQQPAPQGPPQGGAAQITCPLCGKLVAPGKFCAECGKEMTQAKIFCSGCGMQQAPGTKFCSGCGAKMG